MYRIFEVIRVPLDGLAHRVLGASTIRIKMLSQLGSRINEEEGSKEENRDVIMAR